MKANVVSAPQNTSPAKPKRKRDRSKPAVETSTTPLEASELCFARIEEQLQRVSQRANELLGAQRSKVGRWEYFAALTQLEAELRKVR